MVREFILSSSTRRCENTKYFLFFPLEEGAKPLDTNQRMATCVEACIGERNVVARALVEYARRVADWVPLIRNVVPRIENALETTNRIDLRLTNFQESKQKGIWESLIAKVRARGVGRGGKGAGSWDGRARVQRLLRSDSSQSQSSDMTASLSSSSVGSVAFAAALLNRQNRFDDTRDVFRSRAFFLLP